jgi:hypothetical protein
VARRAACGRLTTNLSAARHVFRECASECQRSYAPRAFAVRDRDHGCASSWTTGRYARRVRSARRPTTRDRYRAEAPRSAALGAFGPIVRAVRDEHVRSERKLCVGSRHDALPLLFGCDRMFRRPARAHTAFLRRHRGGRYSVLRNPEDPDRLARQAHKFPLEESGRETKYERCRASRRPRGTRLRKLTDLDRGASRSSRVKRLLRRWRGLVDGFALRARGSYSSRSPLRGARPRLRATRKIDLKNYRRNQLAQPKTLTLHSWQGRRT